MPTDLASWVSLLTGIMSPQHLIRSNLEARKPDPETLSTDNVEGVMLHPALSLNAARVFRIRVSPSSRRIVPDSRVCAWSPPIPSHKPTP